VSFADPDGLALELVETSDAGPGEGWDRADVPAEHQLRGFHSVTLAEEGYEATARALEGVMGFGQKGREGERFRFQVGSGGAGATVDVLCQPAGRRGGVGPGAVHHVAWRTPDDEHQAGWLKTLAAAGFNVSPVMDRTYFHSIYFREPGGILFEIATDGPGFTVDEPAESLGSALRLPPRYEPHRAELERLLPKLRLPG